MLAGNKAVKATAKSYLKGRFIDVLVVSLITIFTYFILNLLSSIMVTVIGEIFGNIFFIAIALFIFIPLFFGFLRYVWRLLFDCVDNPISVFYYFSKRKNYFKIFKFILFYIFKMFCYGIFLFFPAFAVWFISQSFLYELIGTSIPMWTANLNGVFIFLKSFGNILLFILMIKYYLAPFLIVVDDNMDIIEAMHNSKIIARKTGTDFIFLIFSLIGWILLSLFVIPIIYTLPYLATIYLVHCRFCIADYNKNIKDTMPIGDFEFYGEIN